ncbi:CLUMA_CG021562, isoform A [Clunio marinus]|uniref:CLUMA_CG021562, isoform A n=1 Tax=Clunio marinus TaxID=568069 RepID=A0A1J1JA38_9DIPT|nr:CLUMA_CG021562, isoform A [Clunio marinus]
MTKQRYAIDISRRLITRRSFTNATKDIKFNTLMNTIKACRLRQDVKIVTLLDILVYTRHTMTHDADNRQTLIKHNKKCFHSSPFNLH